MSLLNKFKDEFNEEIFSFLDEKIIWADRIDQHASLLYKIIKDFIMNGGKRFRPALFYFAYKSYSQKNLSQIFRKSFTFEFVHTCALIHDDIIDNSALRRGKPTVHEQHSIGTAILCGDLALMLADQTFSTIEKEIISIYNEFKQELVMGEYLDTAKLADIEKIMDLKTGRYSFIKPAVMGLMLAGVHNKQLKQWENILRETGLIFQLKDDYIGTFGDEKSIGKSVKSDFLEKKNTFIVSLFKEKLDRTEFKKFKKIFGREDHFEWYLRKLKQEKIDVAIREIIKQRAEKTIGLLDSAFKDKLLASLLKEIIFNILEFS